MKKDDFDEFLLRQVLLFNLIFFLRLINVNIDVMQTPFLCHKN